MVQLGTRTKMESPVQICKIICKIQYARYRAQVINKTWALPACRSEGLLWSRQVSCTLCLLPL